MYLALHPSIPPVEIIYSRDFPVYYFDTTSSSLYGTIQSSIGVRQGDPIGPHLFNLVINTPLRNIGEGYRDSTTIIIHAFYDNGNYIIKIVFVPLVYPAATEELEKACARVQPENSSCMIPLGTVPILVDEIREVVSVVTGTRPLGAPFAMDFSMSDGPLTPHNINYVLYLLQDSVAAQQTFLDRIVCFSSLGFGGVHSAFRLMITCVVRLYGFLLRTFAP
jgi:hypothetical protein